MPDYRLLYGPRETNVSERGVYQSYGEALEAACALAHHPWVEIDELLDSRTSLPVAVWQDGHPVPRPGGSPSFALAPAESVPLGPRSRPSQLAERATVLA